MDLILIVSDSDSVLEELRSALEDGETEIRELRSGEQVRPAVEDDPPDVLITDLQVGNMGGMAICLDIHLEESGGRIPHVPVLILLDRHRGRLPRPPVGRGGLAGQTARSDPDPARGPGSPRGGDVL